MKKQLLTLLCIISFTIINAQTDKDFAKVYLKRAKQAIETDIDFKLALVHLDKAINRLDTITDRKVASLASLIYFENYHIQPTVKEKLVFLRKSEVYGKQYFLLSTNRDSEEYIDNLESLILIQETIQELVDEEKKLEEERLRKEKELRKIDSLKTVWTNKSKELTINVDSIYKFNKNNVALYIKDGNFGVIDDRGSIIVKAKEYKDAINSEGFILLKNRKSEPNKIYCFNTNNKIGFLIPNVSDFNSLSTHYGQVMLPRGNGRLVLYPNNSYEPMVYDLNVKKIIRIANEKELLKTLKGNDIIDKYNKDGEVKINKEWYEFGGHVGGGIYTLYFAKNYKVNSFLCSVDGNVLKSITGYEYIGAFYNNKLQAIKKGKAIWINQNGTKVTKAKDEYANYLGNSKVVKLDKGAYQIMRNNVIVVGNEELEKMAEFLRKNANK